MRKIIILFACLLGMLLWPLSVSADSVDTSNAGITIDGKFDDWAGKPMTEFYYGPREWVRYLNQVSLLSDNQYIYLYINMNGANLGQSQVLPSDNYDIKIGNETFTCDFTNNLSNPAQAINFSSLSAGQSIKFNVFARDWSNPDPKQSWQKTTAGGEGFATENAKGTQFAELRIPISDLGIKTISGQEISFSSPLLGSQNITIQGASTGPYVLAAGGFLMALLALFGLRSRGFLKRRMRSL